MQNVLVSDGGGFIGLHVTKWFVTAHSPEEIKCPVVVLDDLLMDLYLA